MVNRSAAGAGYRISGAMMVVVAVLSLNAGVGAVREQGWMNGSLLAGLAFAFFGVLFFRLGGRNRAS